MEKHTIQVLIVAGATMLGAISQAIVLFAARKRRSAGQRGSERDEQS